MTIAIIALLAVAAEAIFIKRPLPSPPQYPQS